MPLPVWCSREYRHRRSHPLNRSRLGSDDIMEPSNLLIPYLQLVLERFNEIAVALHDHDI